MWSFFFFFLYWVGTMSYKNWFTDVKPTLYSWDTSHLAILYSHCLVWCCVARWHGSTKCRCYVFSVVMWCKRASTCKNMSSSLCIWFDLIFGYCVLRKFYCCNISYGFGHTHGLTSSILKKLSPSMWAGLVNMLCLWQGGPAVIDLSE